MALFPKFYPHESRRNEDPTQTCLAELMPTERLYSERIDGAGVSHRIGLLAVPTNHLVPRSGLSEHVDAVKARRSLQEIAFVLGDDRATRSRLTARRQRGADAPNGGTALDQVRPWSGCSR